MLPDLTELADLVKAIARDEILPRYTRAERHFKTDGSVVTEADLAVQARLMAALAERWPRFELLGEEMEPARQRELLAGGSPGLWCLDPVDGTSNFAAGLPFFAVSLALLDGVGPALGLVYDPVRDECFSAERGRGAWLNGAPLRLAAGDLPLHRCLAAVDFKRLDPVLAAGLAARPPYGSQRYFGSGALEWCWLAAGRFHVYLHGRHNLWDYAAGALIFAEAGGVAETLAGEPIYSADGAPRSVLAAVDARLLDAWRQAVAERGSAGP